MTKKVRKVVIPAAGFGTRFLPATKASPKEMLPIVDKPIIQYVVEEAVEAGCEQVILVTGSDQTATEEPFVVLWGDDFITASPSRTKQMIDAYEKYGTTILSAILTNNPEDTRKYGYIGGKKIDDGILD